MGWHLNSQRKMKLNFGLLFILTGLVSLILGLLFGIVGAVHFISTESVNSLFPFYKIRPLHVTFVLSWILLAACGGIYLYLPRIYKHNRFSHTLAKAHYYLFLLAGIGIVIAYLFGQFEGREYLEFPAVFLIPVFIGWLLFAINLYSSVSFKKDPMPVYIWMWLVGAIFMIITLAEANLWRLPHFGDNVIRDITVQWKANGALVGCWNMFVYGTATYLITQLSKDKSTATSTLTYFLFFLGFTNLLFNWGHHVYPLPGIKNIKIVSYVISMTELIILGKIIRDFRVKTQDLVASRFAITQILLLLSEKWIFMNLSLALLMSIPAINIYTHGTHITVAHAMGTTIGINTVILLASVFYIFDALLFEYTPNCFKNIKHGINAFHISLLVFWVSLISAGLIKGVLTHHSDMNFSAIMEMLIPFFIVFFIAGLALLIAFLIIALPVITVAIKHFRNQSV